MGNLQTMVNVAKDICDNRSVGYSQARRHLYKDGNYYNGAYWCDCSSMVSYCLRVAGFDVGTVGNGYDQKYQAVNGPDGYTGIVNYLTTYGLVTGLKNAGFTNLGSTVLSQVQCGDILLSSGHVVIALENHGTYVTCASASSDQYAFADQVHCVNYKGFSGYTTWRYLGGSASTTTTTTQTTCTWTQKANYTGNVVNGNYTLTDLQTESNAQLIYRFLLGKGWSNNAISAVIGTWYRESALNPLTWNFYGANSSKSACGKVHTDGGFGLGQWTPATKYLNSSYKPSDYETNATSNANGQLNFFNDDALGQWNSNNEAGMTFAQFKVSTLPVKTLTQYFATFYEGHLYSVSQFISKYGSLDSRISSATEYYNKIVSGAWYVQTDGDSAGSTESNQSITNWWILKRKHKINNKGL